MHPRWRLAAGLPGSRRTSSERQYALSILSMSASPRSPGETVHDRRITVDGVATQYLEAGT